MHDFILAKQIVDEILKIVNEKKLEKISEVDLEVGQIAMAHDGFEEHTHDLTAENIEFNLKSIAKGTILENAKFNIKKIEGDYWKITNIETA
jgi:Zn finger protein HypA/HybF involved in hydrogenase expression